MRELGGWWRIWVVVSILLGGVVWFSASRLKDISDFRSDMTAAEARTWVDAGKVKVRVCDITGVPEVSADNGGAGDLFSGSYYCTSDRQYLLSFLWALVPGAMLAAVGLVARWVFRGFRPAR